MAQTITTTQEAVVSVSFKDRSGNPAIVDGTPVWEVSNPEVLRVVPTEDPSVVVVQAVGIIGSSLLTVRGDADLTEGVRDVVAVETVEVTAGEAEVAELQFGDVREQPPVVDEEPAPVEDGDEPSDPGPVEGQ